MAEGNGNYDWRERMKRLEDSIERNWAAREVMERNIAGLHTSLLQQKDDIDKVMRELPHLVHRNRPERRP